MTFARATCVPVVARGCAWALIVAAAGCASQSSGIQEGGTGLRSVSVGALGGGPAVEVRNEASSAEFSVPVGLPTVWGTLPAIFEQLGIEPTFVDAAQGQIGNPRYTRSRIERRSMSTYIECGSGLTGPYADAYDVRLSLLVYLSSGGQGISVVRTTVDAFATARSTNATAIHCTSKGVLERRIQALVQERVAAG
ncbi:MAG: hypothetical protein FJ207_07740 [Gemmatimonadetes bacterium]|nr:hypothetical protein [Gemmatimonadota bacterium]